MHRGFLPPFFFCGCWCNFFSPPPSTAHGTRLPSFADDFTLYASAESPTAACGHVSSVLRRLKSCLDDRGLEIYSEKTVAMPISPSRSRIPTIDFRINLDGAEMKFVKQTRLLRIIVGDSLSWSYRIDSVCCKVGRKIGALRQLFRLLTPHARRTFFISVIQPDLEYAILAFTPSMNAGLRNRLLAV